MDHRQHHSSHRRQMQQHSFTSIVTATATAAAAATLRVLPSASTMELYLEAVTAIEVEAGNRINSKQPHRIYWSFPTMVSLQIPNHGDLILQSPRHFEHGLISKITISCLQLQLQVQVQVQVQVPKQIAIATMITVYKKAENGSLINYQHYPPSHYQEMME